MTAGTSTISRFELDLALRDAGDVEQVVDEPGEVLRLPLDDLVGVGDLVLQAGPRWASRTALVMAASGFLSSWASIARNSFLCRSASSNSSVRTLRVS